MVGIDLVKISRIEKFYKKFGKKAWERFLRDEEIALVKNSSQRAASFWAAKEAVSKALGCGIGKECSFFDIWIHKDEKGKPYFTLPKPMIKKFQITQTSLSITHENDFAIAIVFIQSTTPQKNLCH